MRSHRRQATPRPAAKRPALQPRVASVLIAPEPFGRGYDIHAPIVSLSAELPTINAARAYANDIAKRHGWAIEDRSEVQ